MNEKERRAGLILCFVAGYMFYRVCALTIALEELDGVVLDLVEERNQREIDEQFDKIVDVNDLEDP